MSRCAALFACILLAAPSLAEARAPRASHAGIQVQVSPDPGGSSGLIRGTVEIDAPPEAVWAVLIDCDLAPRMVRSLKSCRVLERDPAGPLRDKLVIPLGSRRVTQHQGAEPAQADLEQVVGEEFRVHAGAGHTGLAEDSGCRTDGVSEGLACTHG